MFREVIAIIGDKNVGKSNISLQFTSHMFVDEYEHVVCEGDIIKSIAVDGKEHKLELLEILSDTEFIKYSTLVPYTRTNISGFIVVFSYDSRESFQSLESYCDSIIGEDGNCKNVPMVIVGNKCDLEEEERQVTTFEGKYFADSLESLFFESSAKLRINIDEIFIALVREIKRIADESYEQSIVVPTNKNKCILL